MRVLILAAGYGTRLYPLTLHTPKALLPLDKKITVLDVLMERIEELRKKIKIEEIILVSNHKFYKKFIEWRKETKKEIIILDDGSTSAKKRRGAVGDIKFGIGRKEDDWLIVGSDNIFDWKLNSFIRFSLKRRPYPVIGLYRLKDSKKITQLGIVKVKNGIIEELIEKPKKVFSKTIATCIYFFPKESLKFIDQYIKEKKDLDVVGNYIQWLAKKTKVYGYLFKGTWIDIGTKESFEEAKRVFGNAN